MLPSVLFEDGEASAPGAVLFAVHLAHQLPQGAVEADRVGEVAIFRPPFLVVISLALVNELAALTAFHDYAVLFNVLPRCFEDEVVTAARPINLSWDSRNLCHCFTPSPCQIWRVALFCAVLAVSPDDIDRHGGVDFSGKPFERPYDQFGNGHVHGIGKFPDFFSLLFCESYPNVTILFHVYVIPYVVTKVKPLFKIFLLPDEVKCYNKRGVNW